MKKYFRVYLFIISIFMLLSCNGQSNNRNLGKGNDTLVKEIPLSNNPRLKGKPAYIYSVKNEFENELKLSSIEGGFDSIYIRSWFVESRTDTIKLFEFWNNGKGWGGKSILFQDPEIRNLIKLEPDLKIPDSFQIERSLLIRAEKWSVFTTKLLDLGVTSLPNEHEIAKYPGDTDGSWYLFEVATKNKYRLYGLSNPAEYKDEFWQADKVNKIVLLIRNIFNQPQSGK